MQRTRALVLSLALVFVAFVAAGSFREAAAQEAWFISKFHVDYTIGKDGAVDVAETLTVEFGTLQQHGIFRELVTRRSCGEVPAESPSPVYECPLGNDRVYQVENVRVTNGANQPVPVDVKNDGWTTMIRIGDPDRFVTGQQVYRVSYRIYGALNAFAEQDEFYWNASGTSDVVIGSFTATVTLPAAVRMQTACYQGISSTQSCRAASSGSTATYQSTGAITPGSEVTIVLGWPKGVVDVPPPLLEDRPSWDDFFTFDAVEFGGMGLGLVGAMAAVSRLWWRRGRDRRYASLYYLTQDPREHIKPLFSKEEVVIEYLPPDGLRPAQMGVLLDEEADTLDVTATIIDLAVRGYLHITEIPKKGWFGSTDWRLRKLKNADANLLPYEAKLLNSLFATTNETEISDLRNKFAEKLDKVQDELYDDAVRRQWFDRRPDSSKGQWLILGIAVMVVGAAVAMGFGATMHRALLGAPIIVAGLLLVILSPSMSRRTAIGGEALRRTLGFRLYVATAETRMQEFNEQRNIFARYLPYAIVFGCVDKWAKAFEDLEGVAEQSTRGWYTSTTPFNVAAFAGGLSTFSSSVSSTISSTPGSSGGSGFSGGSSGGGGGGGSTGSW